MAKLITVFGGSGFLGRYIVQRLAREGWRVRVAVRRPNEAIFVKPYGAVGQVEPVFCNIRDDASVQAATAGADAVVNCVGILNEAGSNTFEAIHQIAATRIARIAHEQGVTRLVHISALGADPEGASRYSESKGLGEQGVVEEFPGATILRPSVIFGSEDRFFNKFSAMTRFGPVLAIVGGDVMMQPVWVDDVAKAAVKGILGQAGSGIYELGGPDRKSLKSLISMMLGVIERRRLVLDLPFWVGGLIGGLLDGVQGVTVGLFNNSILTRDQVKSLRSDSVVSEGARGFSELKIEPVTIGAILPEYLWPYRASGQYAAIKASAKNLNS